MKQIISYFAILALIAVHAFADGWNSEQTSQTTGSSYTTMDNFVNKDGIHVVRIESGSPNTLKYNLLNSAGTLIRTTTIDNGVSSSPVIIGDNSNKLYAVYVKGTQIIVKQSTDVGQNWTNPTRNTKDFESGHTTSYGIDAVVDGDGKIHIAYATKGQSTDYEVYYYNYNPLNGVWDNFKNVTDFDQYDSGVDPSIAVSSNRVHVTFTNFSKVKSRDRIISNDSWEEPQQINPSNQNGFISSLITDNTNVYVVYTRSYGTGMIVTPLMYSKRSVNGTSWDTPIDLVAPVEHQYPSKIVKTVDGSLYVVYRTSSNIAYRKFNGSTWENEVSISTNYAQNVTVSSSGNDLYVNWLEYNGNWILKYRQYDAAPTVPQNPATSVVNVNGENYPKVSWTANQEPDVYNAANAYEIWRRDDNTGSGNWTSWALKATLAGSTTQYTDFELIGAGFGPKHHEYKLRAKDIGTNLSNYSSVVGIRSGAGLQKHSTLLPKEYFLAQNYPNPFNPTTTLRYELPNDEHVTLKVYDMLGKEVATIVNGFRQAGYYQEQFDASSLTSGVYIYRFTAGQFSSVGKMMLLR